MRRFQTYRPGNKVSTRLRTPGATSIRKPEGDSLEKNARRIELLNLKLNLLMKVFAILFISIVLTVIIGVVFHQINSEEIVVEPLKIFQLKESAPITSGASTNQLFEKAPFGMRAT